MGFKMKKSASSGGASRAQKTRMATAITKPNTRYGGATYKSRMNKIRNKSSYGKGK
jgi:hypothetical protein